MYCLDSASDGMGKDYVDANFDVLSHFGPVGVVARDYFGRSPDWDVLPGCISMEEAELQACLRGLRLAIGLHMPIIVQTYCFFFF
jgi:hypothetical protein